MVWYHSSLDPFFDLVRRTQHARQKLLPVRLIFFCFVSLSSITTSAKQVRIDGPWQPHFEYLLVHVPAHRRLRFRLGDVQPVIHVGVPCRILPQPLGRVNEPLQGHVDRIEVDRGFVSYPLWWSWGHHWPAPHRPFARWSGRSTGCVCQCSWWWQLRCTGILLALLADVVVSRPMGVLPKVVGGPGQQQSTRHIVLCVLSLHRVDTACILGHDVADHLGRQRGPCFSLPWPCMWLQRSASDTLLASHSWVVDSAPPIVLCFLYLPRSNKKK